MRTLHASIAVLVVALLALPLNTAQADVYASNVRITQPTSSLPFDARFDDGTGAAIRFVLSDKADSVVVTILLNSTPVRTLKGTNFLRGDSVIVWDGTNNAGQPVASGDYSVRIATYDQGYGTYTTIYDQNHGIFTRGVSSVTNPALKAFGFFYSADNGGYGGQGTGIVRHAADGTEWGDVKGRAKMASTGAVVGPANLRYSTTADGDGYNYLIGRDARQIFRYHTDSMNVALVDSGGYIPYTTEGLAIRGTGAGRYIAVAAVYNVYGFLLGNNAVYGGAKSRLVYGDSIYVFYDVAFGRDSTMYVTYYSLGDTAKAGVAKFDLTGYSGTPLRLSDAQWRVTVDSGRVNTLTYWMNPSGSDASADRIYFVNVDIAGGANPGAGVGVHAITNLHMAQPTRTYIYNESDQNNTQFRADVTADAVGNAIYMENTTENVVMISPPTGANSYTYNALAKIKVVVSIPISAARIDANNDYVPDRVGDTVTVIGIVNSINPTASSNRWQYMIQDGTGGITVTKGSETGGGQVFNVGDRIAVKGVVGQFNGVTQINVTNVATDVSLLDVGNTLTPAVLTIEQLLANPEAYESMLIKINGVGKTAASVAWPASNADANMTIWDGYSSLTMRIDRDTDMDGSTEPVFPVDVKGTLTQFDSSSPFDGGYQISPNFRTDFTENVAVPPNPRFAMVNPANGSTITLSDAFTVAFTWNRAVDLNGDALIYQWAPVGQTAITTGNAGADTFLVRTGPQLGAYLGSADSVVLRWTTKTKDAGPIVNNRDTVSVTIKRGTLTSAETLAELPREYALMQNYPNPFNPTTNIRVALPTASTVVLKVYNILGQEVATLFDGFQGAGYVNVVWNGRDQFGHQVASGMYLYRVEAKSLDGTQGFVSNRKMLMMK